MCVIDPMHNLLLGTAKRTIEVWKNVSILDSKCFSTIQNKVDSFISPPKLILVVFHQKLCLDVHVLQ